MAHVSSTIISLTLLISLYTLTAAFSIEDYSEIFEGDGTYYGGNKYTGNCAIRAPIPRFYNDYVAVAINEAQYDGACGACLRVTGTGKGLGANPIKGTFMAYVADRCFECSHGDLDLSTSGDGRWDISWEFVPCPGEKRISFQFEGSNRFYWKFQPRGMKSPAKRVIVNGRDAVFKQDNHWVIRFPGKLEGAAKVEVHTVLGRVITSYISKFPIDARGVVYGGSIPGGSSKASKGEGKKKEEEKKKEEKKKEEKKKDDDKELEFKKGRNTSNGNNGSQGSGSSGSASNGGAKSGKRISFLFEGSNPWWWKLRPQGLSSRTKRVVINGLETTYVPDNFWILQFPYKVTGNAKVMVYTESGKVITSYISKFKGVVYGSTL